MSFLNTSNSEFLSARITRKGRQYISEGNFNINYFQIGDSEFDYNFNDFTGVSEIPSQRVLSPMDGDNQIKYPYLLYSGSTISYGDPIKQPTTLTIKNEIGAAGFVSNYFDYDLVEGTGSTVECIVKEINITAINGTNTISVSDATDFSSSKFVTILFGTRLTGVDYTISGSSQSLVYKVISTSPTELVLDRETPDLSGETGYAQIIGNKCNIEYSISGDISSVCLPAPVDNSAQHDPWSMEIVWTQKPAGLDSTDEDLTGYTGNQFASTKEYLGYTSSSGQTFTNFTGGTITNPTSYVNSFNEQIKVSPEDQRCIAIIHFSDLGDGNDPDKFYKYDDYIASETEDVEFFEVYIPFLYYHRNTGTTIGAVFVMDSTDYYISSTKNLKPNSNNIKFRYLKDEQGYFVGKVFLDKKIIVFDDQEIVATLEYKTNRKYTLPAPRFSITGVDIPCAESLLPLVTTGQTAWVTYMFSYSGDTKMTGMYCNYFGKLTGTTDSNISFKFNTDAFQFMNNTSYLNGYIANQMFAIVQVTATGTQPSSDSWRIIDITSQISGHTIGNLINPNNLTGYQFVVTDTMYDAASLFDLETYLGSSPNTDESTLPQFGDSQPFPGSVKLVRATDIKQMTFLINLPATQFTETQNPTYTSGDTKRITEIALLNQNKEVIVMAKCSKPIERIGTQIFSVNLDF